MKLFHTLPDKHFHSTLASAWLGLANGLKKTCAVYVITSY